MKKIMSYAAIWLLASLSCGAMPLWQERPALDAESAELVFEDFANFSDGTEDAPGAAIEYVDRYHIPETMTAQAGWTGGGIFQAGGCILLDQFKTSSGNLMSGYISTPPMKLAGTATLTFRAKPVDGKAELWVAMCDDLDGVGIDQKDIEMKSAADWATYQLVARHGSLTAESYFQIMAYKGKVMIDDVRLVIKYDRIATPEINRAINESESSFTASWGKVAEADRYLLTVYETSPKENPAEGEKTMDFDFIKITEGANTIDTEATQIPEGWKIKLNGSYQVTTSSSNRNSGPMAVIVSNVADTIESPELPYPLDGLKFWVKPSAYTDNQQGEMSLIRIEIYHSRTGKWDNIAQIPYNWMERTGGFHVIDSEALGSDATKVRIGLAQKGRVNFYVDDIVLHYRERGNVTKLLDAKEVADTFHTVEGISAENDYIYGVQAARGSVISEPSHFMWVDGLAGLKPVTVAPAVVQNGWFTATWQPIGHATEYLAELYKAVTPKEDSTVVILSENFNAITEGTLSRPGKDEYATSLNFSTKGWTRAAWGATQPAWIKGMGGTGGTSAWAGNAGLVYSPVLDLSCLGTNPISVETTVVTTVKEFDYGNGNEGEGMFAILLRSPFDLEALAFGYMDTPEVGSNSGVMVIDNITPEIDLSHVIVAFMNKSGEAFYVDDVKVSATVPGGKTIMVPVQAITTTETSCDFGNLDGTADHGYVVTASASHEFEDYVSERSDLRLVENSQAGVIEVEAAGISAGAIYDLQGRRVEKPRRGIYIINGRKILMR